MYYRAYKGLSAPSDTPYMDRRVSPAKGIPLKYFKFPLYRKNITFVGIYVERVYKFALLGLSGVLWKLDKVIEGSPAALNKLRELGKRIMYITNNNIKPREYYVDKARKLGFIAEEEEILSTAYLTAEYLKSIGFNKKAYVVGSEGLVLELDRVGISNIGVGVNF